MKTAKYKFRQAELYSIARFVLAAVNNFLPRFSAFKGKYTAAWLSARQLQTDAAENLKDEDQRDADYQTKRVALDEKRELALDYFNSLKRYIIEVFSPDLVPIKIDAAGGNYYTVAAQGDFDATDQLLTRGNQFIIDNTATLDNAGQNMPASFPPQFATLKTDFKAGYTDLLGSEAGAELGTEDKIDANNEVYKFIVDINADAQAIFLAETEQAERDQFILEEQLLMVRGAGVAGMRFHVTDALTGADIEGVLIVLKQGVTVTTDQAGRALKLQLAAGEYAIAAQKTGYTQYNALIIVETGVVKRVDIQLTQ